MCDAQILIDGAPENSPFSAAVRLVYDGEEYAERDGDEFYINQLVRIQKRLPDSVKIACCMTCRHGNECVYGNIPGEYYCFKDLRFSCKNDLLPYMTPERLEARRRDFAFVCNVWQPQSKEYFTYNEFIDLL